MERAAEREARARRDVEKVADEAGRVPDRSPAGMALDLQRRAGNRVASGLLALGQARLQVGRVDDPLEREADMVARQVVQALQSRVVPAGEGTRKDPPGIRRRARVGAEGGDVDSETEFVITRATGGGRPLEAKARRRFEDAFGGADFSRVRLHSGPDAADLNDRVSAEAFTVGQDVFFRDGIPDVGTAAGQDLVAHELTHTIQQSGGQVGRRADGAAGPAEQTVGDVEDAGGGVVQRRNGDSKKKTAKKKKAQARKRAQKRKSNQRQPQQQQQQQQQQQPSQSGGLWSWIGSMLPGTTSYEPPSEEEEEDDEDGLFEDLETEGGSEDELNLPDEPEEVKSIGEQLLAPFMPENVSIELGKAEGEMKGTRVGDVKGGVSQSMKGDLSVETGVKGSVKGRRGEGSGEAKLVNKLDSYEGEGKVEMLLGVKHEAKSGDLGWEIEGHKLQGGGELAYMRGLMAEAAVKAKYDLTTGDLSAAAKAGAFAGVKTEGTVRVKYLAGGKDYGEAEGKVGISWGIGGELQGAITWKGGVLSMNTSGSFAAGPGLSYSYKLSLNTTNIVQAAPGLLWSLWQWMTTVPEGTTEEDFWV
jgi:hypothetical protein